MSRNILRPVTTTVKDGLELTVREVGPADSTMIELGFEQLSDQSRALRFMAPKSDLTDKELDYFSAPNNKDHLAIGAAWQNDNTTAPVGIARYIRSREDPEVADIAITIVDKFQRRGVGTLLLAALAKTASANGITTFSALVSGDNEAMLSILISMGAQTNEALQPEIALSLPIFSDPLRYPDNEIGERIRQVYSQVKIQPSTV